MPAYSRHASLDLAWVISANVDIGHDIGGGAARLHVDPEAKVRIKDDDAKRAGPKLTLDIIVSLARSIRPAGIAWPSGIERMDAETLVAKGVRSVLDGPEVQTHSLEKFGRESRLLDAVLDDRWARRWMDPCGSRAFVDQAPRPGAPVLRDRPPVAASEQMLELEDVAAMGAAGEALEAAAAMEA